MITMMTIIMIIVLFVAAGPWTRVLFSIVLHQIVVAFNSLWTEAIVLSRYSTHNYYDNYNRSISILQIKFILPCCEYLVTCKPYNRRNVSGLMENDEDSKERNKEINRKDKVVTEMSSAI